MNLHPNERTGIPRLEVEDDEFREEENGQERARVFFVHRGKMVQNAKMTASFLIS